MRLLQEYRACDLYGHHMKRISLLLLAALACLALTASTSLAAPSALKWSPKKPAAGQKVTVSGKGFKKRAKYKITVNDVVYKRHYRTTRKGRLKFSFEMPQIPAGDAIFVGVKVGRVYRIAEIFIADKPPVDEPDKMACGDSPFPPYPDGTCPDFDFENEYDESEG